MLRKQVYLILLLLVRSVKLDEYVREALSKCSATKSLLECTKYNLLNFIKRLDVSFFTDIGILMPRRKQAEVTVPSYQPDDPELLKFVKFIVRKVISIVSSQAVELGLLEDDGSNDDDLEADGNSTALSIMAREDNSFQADQDTDSFVICTLHDPQDNDDDHCSSTDLPHDIHKPKRVL
nr:unnamed protein product [Callosobruchus analis]